MKKLLAILICIATLFSLTSCLASLENAMNEKEQERLMMLESFPKKDGVILLTTFELFINDTHYKLDEIKHDGKICNAVLLEADGFYAYTFDKVTREVEFLFVKYEGFTANSLGTEILPSNIINAFFGDGCFWFRMDDPDMEKFGQMYFSWNIDTKESSRVNSEAIDKDYEYSKNNTRAGRYSYSYNSKIIGSFLEVTDNVTNVTKKATYKTLRSFDEGNKIADSADVSFNVSHVFEKDGKIFIASGNSIDFVGLSPYYYVYTWDFETEECEFYTYILFDGEQGSVIDMYIIGE